jgi:hypothetical protein
VSARLSFADKNARGADPRAAYRLRLEQALALLADPMPIVGRFPVVTGTRRRNRVEHAVAQAREALRRAIELAG